MKITPLPVDFTATRAELMRIYKFMEFVPESDAIRYRKSIEDVLISLQDYERDFQELHLCRRSPFEMLTGAGNLGEILDKTRL